jgi:hypothetical protein
MRLPPITLPALCNEKWLMLVGVIIYSTTSWFSVGNIQLDEHF